MAGLTVVSLPDSAQAKFSDTLDIDHDRQMVFLADNWSGGVDVFDVAGVRPRYETTIRLKGRLFGVAVASDLRKLFVGLTGSTLAVVDIGADAPSGYALATQINTGGSNHVDLLDYEEKSSRVYAANRLDGFIVTIDGNTNEIIGRTHGLGRGLEQPRFNPADGMVYVTDNKENVLYQIDPATSHLRNTFLIEDPCYPNGLAINPTTNCGLLACGNRERPRTVIWDFGSQTIQSVLEGCGCGDGALYDQSTDRFLFAASGFRDGPVVGIFGGDPVRLLRNVQTRPGASWVSYGRRNRMIYAPTVEHGRPALLSIPMPDI